MQIQKVSTSNQNFGRLSGQLKRFAQEAMIEQPNKASKIAKAVREINELSSNRIINEKTSSNGFNSIVFEPKSPMAPEGYIKSIRHRCTLGFFKEILNALKHPPKTHGRSSNDFNFNIILSHIGRHD